MGRRVNWSGLENWEGLAIAPGSFHGVFLFSSSKNLTILCSECDFIVVGSAVDVEQGFVRFPGKLAVGFFFILVFEALANLLIGRMNASKLVDDCRGVHGAAVAAN